MDLQTAVITIDVIGKQTAIAAQIVNGGGFNGSIVINGLTVLGDGYAIDTQFSEGGSDWFWKFGGDSVGDRGTGKTESVN